MLEADASEPTHHSLVWSGRLAFGLSFGAIALLAVRGGTYDIVARQEAGVAVWWVLALGFGLGVLPRSRPHPLVVLPLGALLALGAWTFASLSWTESDERTLAEGCRIVGYFGLLVLVISALDRRTWRAAAAGLTAGALLAAALATSSRLAPGLFPTDPVRELSNSRLNYPFNYWNAVGAWGAMAVTAALAWSVGAARPAARAAFRAAIPFAGLSIYLSYSRAAIAGLAVGLICVLALSRSRVLAALHFVVAGAATGVAVLVTRGEPSIARGVDGSGAGTVVLVLVACTAVCAAAAVLTWRVRADERWRVPPGPSRFATAAAVTCLLLASVVVGPGLASRAWDSFRASGEPPALSSDPAQRLGSLHGSRYSVWSAALDTYQANSSRGTGAGTFEFSWNRAGKSPEFVRDVHSIYIEPLSETGWPGALFMLSFLVAVAVVSLRALARTRRPSTHGAGVALVAVLAVFLVQAGVDWMWEMTAVTAVGLGGAAVLWARLGEPRPRPRLPVLVRVTAAAACLLMCLLLIPGLVSTSLVRESQRSAADGDLRGAAVEADDALASAPWAATPRLQRALVAETSGDFRVARAHLQDALEREPENWRLPLILSRVEAELGRSSEAIRQFRRARRLRPRATVFQTPPSP